MELDDVLLCVLRFARDLHGPSMVSRRWRRLSVASIRPAFDAARTEDRFSIAMNMRMGFGRGTVDMATVPHILAKNGSVSMALELAEAMDVPVSDRSLALSDDLTTLRMMWMTGGTNMTRGLLRAAGILGPSSNGYKMYAKKREVLEKEGLWGTDKEIHLMMGLCEGGHVEAAKTRLKRDGEYPTSMGVFLRSCIKGGSVELFSHCIQAMRDGPLALMSVRYCLKAAFAGGNVDMINAVVGSIKNPPPHIRYTRKRGEEDADTAIRWFIRDEKPIRSKAVFLWVRNNVPSNDDLAKKGVKFIRGNVDALFFMSEGIEMNAENLCERGFVLAAGACLKNRECNFCKGAFHGNTPHERYERFVVACRLVQV